MEPNGSGNALPKIAEILLAHLGAEAGEKMLARVRPWILVAQREGASQQQGSCNLCELKRKGLAG